MDATQGRGARAEVELAAIAARQHNVFAREQAKRVGFTARMMGSRLRGFRWARVEHNVFRSTMSVLTWEGEVMAACLAGPAVASHRAAARLLRFPGFEDALAEVTAYRHRRHHETNVLLHESRFLDEGRDTTFIDGIPVTTPTRTIVDLSRVSSAEQIEIALDNARHRGLTDATRVRQDLDRLQRPNGTKRIEAVLDLKLEDDAPPESPLESRAAIALREGGLPAPTPQFVVHDGTGFVGRVDFAWPDQMVILEVDGFSIHGNRAAWERDHIRQNRLVAAGWRVLRTTHEQLSEPEAVVTELRRSLGAVRVPNRYSCGA